MSFYNMLFGQNPMADILLAIVGIKRGDVERFRDAFVSEDGTRIDVYTRTGGGNREDYPQMALYRNPLFAGTRDDDFDSTYATFSFTIPAEFVPDVEALYEPPPRTIRPEFTQHIEKVLGPAEKTA